jgi:lipopolysaccharide export system permease protein
VKILTRYILIEAVIYFLISLFAFTGILMTVRMIRFANLIINKGVEFNQIFSVFVSIVPAFLEVAIPMSTLLGIMLAFARLSGDSEIVVIRASGVGIHQLLSPVIMFGAVALLLNLFVCVYLSPMAFGNLSRILFEIARTKSTAGLSAGVFNKLGDLTLYADKINHQTGRIENVLVDDKRKRESRKVVIAHDGMISSDERSRTITLRLFDGDIHEILDGKYTLTNFQVNNLKIQTDEIYPDEEEAKKGRTVREMFVGEIGAQIADYRTQLEQRKEEELQPDIVTEKLAELSQGDETVKPEPQLDKTELKKRINKLRVERVRRFTMPFASVILAVMALPLGVQPPRAQKAWGSAISVALGMLVFISYYGFLSIGIALGESGKLHPVAALWLPNIIALAVTLYALYQICSERWNSISGIFEGFITFSGRKLKGMRRGVAQ